ncbi:MAG: hypothetical protein N3A01_03395, partial [Bacteroidales bacterium]|nr:hypothetical protein [Bacteroidales bacterium]
MSKILLLFLFLIIWFKFFSQVGYFYIKGENIVQTSGCIVLQDIHWKNSGKENLYSGSYVKFTGNTLQQISGDSVTTFAGIIINNSGGGVYLNQNVEIKDTLRIISGYFDLKDKIADFGTTGYLTGEDENNRVRAT